MYCTRTDIEAIFGTQNVTKWADLDGDAVTSKINARITRAIETATAQVNDLLRGGPVIVPIAADPVPPVFVDATARLAAVLLYESRGVTDYDETSGEPRHRLSFVRRSTLETLRMIRTGAVRTELSDTEPVMIHGPEEPEESKGLENTWRFF